MELRRQLPSGEPNLWDGGLLFQGLVHRAWGLAFMGLDIRVGVVSSVLIFPAAKARAKDLQV